MKLLKRTTISLESQRHRTTPLTRFRERPLLQPFSLTMIKGLKVSRISLFVVCTAKNRITPLHAKESPIHKSAEKYFKERTDVLCASALVIVVMNVDQRKRAGIANKDTINRFVEDSTRR